MRFSYSLAVCSFAMSCTASGSIDAGIDTGLVCHDYETIDPPIDRSCTIDADCIVAVFATTCCGGMATGINAHDRARLDAEMSGCWRGDCGCPHAVVTDDDLTVLGWDASIVVAHCDSGICATTAPGYTACAGTYWACRPDTFCGSQCATLPDGGVIPEPTCLTSAPACGSMPACACMAAAHLGACAGGTCVDTADGGYTCTCP